MQDASRGDVFSGRVMVVFGTQVLGAAIGIINGILIARLLGPAGKGDYYLLVLVPSTAMVLLQLGLPQAFSFFAARDRTGGLLAKAFLLTAALSVVAVVVVGALLPILQDAFLRGLGLDQILFAFIAFPLALNSTFTTGIVTGRQAVRWYAGVMLADQLSTTVLLVVVVAAGLVLSVNAAIAVYLVAWVIHTIGFAVGARQVTATRSRPERVSYRDLFGYGLPLFPGSLAGFFSSRVDVYLIAFLIASPSEQLGYYSMAVGLAEMVFFFPRAVSTLFFPHVAGAPREDSDRQVSFITRVTLLVTGSFAVLLVPGAFVMISLLLPAYGQSFAPLVVLLPGVVALSATNVVSGYLAGIGKTGITSAISIAALSANVVANLVLIPRLGIIGASTASLLSYSLSSLLMTAFAVRLTGTPITAFWIPRVSDGRFVLATIVSLLRRARSDRRPPAKGPGA